MHRPFFSQSPKRVGSGPLRPPISTGVSWSEQEEDLDASLSAGVAVLASDAGVRRGSGRRGSGIAAKLVYLPRLFTPLFSLN